MVGRAEMDAAYALEMRAEGFSYREIGAELAKRENRTVPYQALSVRQAISLFVKKLEAAPQPDWWD